MSPVEYELDPVTFARTGRTRTAQFLPTMRYLAVPPSKRTSLRFTTAQHDQQEKAK